VSVSLAVGTRPALDLQGVPRHVAIIMDGNRRWAKERGLPAIEGHRRGMIALRHVTRAASDLGMDVLTVYGFSTENWNRDAREVSLLFELCVYFAHNELIELRRNNVRVRVIGEWESLPNAPRKALAELQDRTAGNTGLILNLAVNYSSPSWNERSERSLVTSLEARSLPKASMTC
jgi:undecaprenyl diphosphate synthase